MIVCITNRILCEEDFLTRIKEIVKAKPDRIILREKDLSVGEYEKLARNVVLICKKYQVKCMLHTHIELAEKLKYENIHLSFKNFVEAATRVSSFQSVGVSVHSVEEAVMAEKLGASYILAGHIFITDCKKNVPPRGLKYLQDICKQVSIPVIALGGITIDNIEQIKRTNAKGVALMSGFMQTTNPIVFMEQLRSRLGD